MQQKPFGGRENGCKISELKRSLGSFDRKSIYKPRSLLPTHNLREGSVILSVVANPETNGRHMR